MIDTKEFIEDSLINKKALFFKMGVAPERVFNYSSTLDKIGKEWDRVIKNNTEVIVLSDIVELQTDKYGYMFLIEIMADESMWVLSEDLIIESDF